ncbi:hypothetical protein OnM2_051071 [Erysiphe neolycopersici]|uniref:Uncharacterized protein n=1 Tax=Erysiphe neolycopersici TaxID=212602 RepID=A0A420HSC8_9PEZI|nr:hypothetical protein OnM2_051071 [Erysiphe neolycopersici]
MWSNHISNLTSPINGSLDAQLNLGVKYQGKQIAQIIKIKPQFVDEFKKVQAQMWPEVVAQFKECCVEDIRSFMTPKLIYFFQHSNMSVLIGLVT